MASNLLTALGRDLTQDENDAEEGVMEGASARVAIQGHSHLPGKLNKRKKPGIEESPRSQVTLETTADFISISPM